MPPARRAAAELHTWSRLCGCHPSHRLGDSQVQDILCGTDTFHWLLPPAAHPFLQRAPVLLPRLITRARCLGVSVCQPVALSVSIMSLSGRPHSLCVNVCVCVIAFYWQHFFLLDSFFFSQLKHKGKLLQSRGCSH